MASVLSSLNAVRIFVEDLDRARDFYGSVLELAETAAGEAYAAYDVGNVAIVVEAVPTDDAEGLELVGNMLPVSFNVTDNIDAIYQRLTERGVEFLQPPEKQSWGGTLAYFRDPDGNILTLIG